MRHFFFVPLVMTALSGCAVKAPVSEMTAIAPLAAPALSVESAEGGRDFIAQIADFSALEGWREDSHDVALKAFADVCGKILARDPDAAMGGASFGLTPLAGYAEDWRGPCQAAAAVRPGQERAFFEQWFLPVRIASSTTDPALYTGYFEPELEGSLTPSDVYRYPIYRTPANLERGAEAFSRASIDAGSLAGQGLEIAWVKDPVDLFFLHIQGSGRIRLENGRTIRVGYAERNGHGYKSIGAALAQWGEVPIEEVSAGRIKRWIAENPTRMNELFAVNPSYIFFRTRDELSAETGPVGAFGTPLPALRSVAVDRGAYALGAPLWIEAQSPVGLLRRVMLALDVGGAIKGAQRADIFWGSGPDAGVVAGQTKHGGRMFALLPRRALARLREGVS